MTPLIQSGQNNQVEKVGYTGKCTEVSLRTALIRLASICVQWTRVNTTMRYCSGNGIRSMVGGYTKSDSATLMDRLCTWGLGEIQVKRMSGMVFLLEVEDSKLYNSLKQSNWSYLKEVFYEIQPCQLDKIDSVIDLEAGNERFQIRVAEVPSPEELSYTYKGKKPIISKACSFSSSSSSSAAPLWLLEVVMILVRVVFCALSSPRIVTC
ncbi:hypothetical protein GQ457_13G023710 [Hibiscus cannabinus]